MQTDIELVSTWCRSVSVMHIAHHKAASRYAKWHRWLGCTAAAMAAIVGSTVFASLSEAQSHAYVVLATGFLSMLAAGLIAVQTFLHLDDRARMHLIAAADFQRLRRELEEEEVRLKAGNGRETYSDIADRWHEVLKSSPPLPQRIHDAVDRDLDSQHAE